MQAYKLRCKTPIEYNALKSINDDPDHRETFLKSLRDESISDVIMEDLYYYDKGEWLFKCNLNWAQLTRYIQLSAPEQKINFSYIAQTLKPADDFNGMPDNPFAFLKVKDIIVCKQVFDTRALPDLEKRREAKLRRKEANKEMIKAIKMEKRSRQRDNREAEAKKQQDAEPDPPTEPDPPAEHMATRSRKRKLPSFEPIVQVCGVYKCG